MEYKVLSNSERIYKHMISDIRKAKREILLETYIYRNDKIGRLFRSELTKKAKQGVRVQLLIDAWGSNVRKGYFRELIQNGGRVRFFRELRYAFRWFNANHERNHRKLLLIDRNISYIGSINITEDSLNWEELVLRVVGSLAVPLKRAFVWTWKRFNIFKYARARKIRHEDFRILQDFPRGNIAEKRYSKLILNANKEIVIATPYFIPSNRIRSAFKKAIKKGVEVKIILPKSSDVRIVDLLRRRYLGSLHKMGVKLYYHPKVLHAKLLIVDNKFFLLGSSNLDYRSFMHQFEINLLGYSQEVITSLKEYSNKLQKTSEVFDYDVWVKRHFLSRFKDWIAEKIIRPFREYL